jgi:hypothetical protein
MQKDISQAQQVAIREVRSSRAQLSRASCTHGLLSPQPTTGP